MEHTSTAPFFKWLEAIWTQGNAADDRRPEASLAAGEEGGRASSDWQDFQQAHHTLREGLADIQLGLESFTSDGDHITCAMVVRARDKYSGEPVAFRSTFEGRVREGRLVSASNAIDYLAAG